MQKSAENVENALAQKKEQSENMIVLISADKKVFHEHTVKMITIIQKLGINKFGLTVDPLNKKE